MAGVSLAQKGKETSTRQSPQVISDKELNVIFPTALLRNIALRDLQAVRDILASGVSPNAKDYSRHSHIPIHVAIDAGNIEVLELLIRAGARLESKDSLGTTPLMMAAIGGKVELAKRLLSGGAKVNARDDGGGTALIYAAREGQLEMVKLLLNDGANPTLESTTGVNALMIAADNAELIDILVEGGSDLEAQDKSGWTAVCWAIVSKQPKKLDALIRRGAKPKTECSEVGN
jgi:ankyrin repeat protein